MSEMKKIIKSPMFIGAFLGANYALMSYYTAYKISEHLFGDMPVLFRIMAYPSVPGFFSFACLYWLTYRNEGADNHIMGVIVLGLVNMALWAGIGMLAGKVIIKIYERRQRAI